MTSVVAEPAILRVVVLTVALVVVYVVRGSAGVEHLWRAVGGRGGAESVSDSDEPSATADERDGQESSSDDVVRVGYPWSSRRSGDLIRRPIILCGSSNSERLVGFANEWEASGKLLILTV